MTTIYRTTCNQCGAHYVGEDAADKFDEGWIEVWRSEDRALDFCDQECLVHYYQREDG